VRTVASLTTSWCKQCFSAGTYGLPGGQIATVVGYGKGYSGSHTSRDPIVGGSGAYAGARGEISDREVGPREDQLVFHLARKRAPTTARRPFG
jgi:hypothetical protein